MLRLKVDNDMILLALWVISFPFLETMPCLYPFPRSSFHQTGKFLEQGEICCFDQITYFSRVLTEDSQLTKLPNSNTLHFTVL